MDTDNDKEDMEEEDDDNGGEGGGSRKSAFRTARTPFLRTLSTLGKWSLADVLVVCVLIAVLASRTGCRFCYNMFRRSTRTRSMIAPCS